MTATATYVIAMTDTDQSSINYNRDIYYSHASGWQANADRADRLPRASAHDRLKELHDQAAAGTLRARVAGARLVRYSPWL